MRAWVLLAAVAAMPFVLVLAAHAADAAPTWRIYATREGLVGHTTSNGHVIQTNDHFVALPSTKNLNCNGCTTYQVKVCGVSSGRCATAPQWDVGPWNTRDDYWNPSSVRTNWNDLPQGKPEAQAAYQDGYNWVSNCKNLDGSYSGHGGGADQFGRCVLNPAGIDLADGTAADVGINGAGWVDVTFLWVADPPPADSTDPVTTSTLTGTRGDNGWWVSAVTVKLTATDSGSGVASTHYRVDGGSWKTYSGAFSVGGEGAHTVNYYSVDKAGNTETTRTASFSIDTVDPATSRSLAGTAGNAGWWRSAVTVTLSPSDATSGVASTAVTRDGAGFAYGGAFGVSGEGTHTVTYAARDRAGNVEATRTFAASIDSVAPATSLARSGPAWQGDQLYVSEATRFTLAASDATSGAAASSWSWRGAAQGYAGTFGLGGTDGTGSLQWRSQDVAGNVEGWRSAGFFLDTTPPAVALTAPPDGAVIASLDPTVLKADASDAGSGLARVEFLVDGAVRATLSAAPWSWSWDAGSEALGDHVLTARATDHLGHAASAQRKVSTVPTSAAGAQATAAKLQRDGAAYPVGFAQSLAQRVVQAVPAPPSRLPVVGVVAEADPASGAYRVGLAMDGTFVGTQGRLPG